jgi:hypothetical protein
MSKWKLSFLFWWYLWKKLWILPCLNKVSVINWWIDWLIDWLREVLHKPKFFSIDEDPLAYYSHMRALSFFLLCFGEMYCCALVLYIMLIHIQTPHTSKIHRWKQQFLLENEDKNRKSIGITCMLLACITIHAGEHPIFDSLTEKSSPAIYKLANKLM